MHDGQPTSRMLVYPAIESQYFALLDDDDVAISNEAFDLPWSEDLVSAHGCDGKVK